MFVDHDNYNSAPKLNPFYFKHFDLRDVTFKWYSRNFPSERYNMDWKNKTGLLEPYHHFLGAIGIKSGNATNGISLQKYTTHFHV